jgi:hypothetical protein
MVETVHVRRFGAGQQSVKPANSSRRLLAAFDFATASHFRAIVFLVLCCIVLFVPGFVTIPAGDRRALIPVVPIDDGPPDISSTVVLRLLPSTNSPLDYVLGFPHHAAALILDGRRPHPSTAALADRCFHLNASGPDGAWFRIEYSTNLRDWIPICNNQVIQGSIDFVDPDAQTDSSRLYRAVPINGPPAD